MSDRIDRALVPEALREALVHRPGVCDLVHHSDRGSQSAGHDYREALDQAGITCSMSRRGNCWDNAVSESFFGTLKMELLYELPLQTRSATRSAVADYIEVFYNVRQRHSSLDYLSPAEFELKNGGHGGFAPEPSVMVVVSRWALRGSQRSVRSAELAFPSRSRLLICILFRLSRESDTDRGVVDSVFNHLLGAWVPGLGGAFAPGLLGSYDGLCRRTRARGLRELVAFLLHDTTRLRARVLLTTARAQNEPRQPEGQPHCPNIRSHDIYSRSPGGDPPSISRWLTIRIDINKSSAQHTRRPNTPCAGMIDPTLIVALL